MNETLTASRPAQRARRPDLVPAVVVGLFTAVLLVAVATTLRTPDHVSLTVDNPLEWRTEVSVRGAGDADWTDAGAVSRGDSLEFLQLPDQGSDWVFRFSYGGQSTEVQVTRDQLKAEGWTVEVPAALGTALQEAGVPATTGSTAGRANGAAPSGS